MKILLVAATLPEIQPTIVWLEHSWEKVELNFYKKNNNEIHILITGVGLTATAYQLGKTLAQNKYDLCLNAGIAGAFEWQLLLGDIVEVESECFGDLGAEDGNGNFLDIFEMNLLESNNFPFKNKILKNPACQFPDLKKVRALSVNKVHGNENSILNIQKKYASQIESMEGAAFFYVCLHEKIPFAQIRSISNYVEKRNRANWDIPLAIKKLNDFLIKLVH